jgi:hypothetical protein
VATPIDGLTTTGATALGDVDNFVRGSNVNVLYKAFALVAVLIVFAMIPQTSRFAAWAAWLILLVLLVQKNP